MTWTRLQSSVSIRPQNWERVEDLRIAWLDRSLDGREFPTAASAAMLYPEIVASCTHLKNLDVSITVPGGGMGASDMQRLPFSLLSRTLPMACGFRLERFSAEGWAPYPLSAPFLQLHSSTLTHIEMTHYDAWPLTSVNSVHFAILSTWEGQMCALSWIGSAPRLIDITLGVGTESGSDTAALAYHIHRLDLHLIHLHLDLDMPKDPNVDIGLLSLIASTCPLLEVLSLQTMSQVIPPWVNSWTHQTHREGSMSAVCDVLTQMRGLRDLAYHYGFPHEMDAELSWVRRIERDHTALVRCTFQNSAFEYLEGRSPNINGWLRDVDGEWCFIAKSWPWRED
ncbi:uncharacterized protein STEHIDRAFT_154369 [Stereum hirsutum FP-91666 SS1]|uniref:uncharacterized protein n=1 Tax=Stereum hirsutum (strain FP-91666) TaxID=721885 RepID=UPI000440FE06|nr:uncharacterized protein STEHIDRAFT_154369 [Stereum hirsutum FP-91666 SS1]EIM88642.1 hypothetical protein STEHIDRAFT_154369 [Stereum hirsutum FP-91666 SS1]